MTSPWRFINSIHAGREEYTGDMFDKENSYTLFYPIGSDIGPGGVDGDIKKGLLHNKFVVKVTGISLFLHSSHLTLPRFFRRYLSCHCFPFEDVTKTL